MRIGLVVLLVLFYGKPTGRAEAVGRKEEGNNQKVVVITLDGFRWQELFSGADTVLLQQAAAKGDPAVHRAFYHPDVQSRRSLLMPFMWKVLAEKGQLAGNRDAGSRVNVANPYALSYAGYNELFTGKPDLRLWSNDKLANPNKTILEYLNKQGPLRGKVATIGSWELFPYIFNKARSRIFCNSGGGDGAGKAVRNDRQTFTAACAYLRQHLPKVLHLGLGGTDEAGHQNDYAAYLRQAHDADQMIAGLWQLVQSIPFYRGQTTFIITTDHGRGKSRGNWNRHGFFVPGSSQTWLAMLGNRVTPSGESRNKEQLYSGQVAGSIAYLLGAIQYGAKALPLTRFTQSPNADANLAMGR